MTDRKYIKYTYSGSLNPGDIVEINQDGIPYVYEGLEGLVNSVPLCAHNMDNLPIYDSCHQFLSANGRIDEIMRHEYAEKDYSTETIPVSAFDKIYINPNTERTPGSIICMNGKQFVKTGGIGTATHLLSAIPKTCEAASDVLLAFDSALNLLGKTSTDPLTATPLTGTGTDPLTGTGTDPLTATPTPSTSLPSTGGGYSSV